MRRFVLWTVLTCCVAGLGGCWFYDPEHNARHNRIILKDIAEIHSDIDFLLALESESPLIEEMNK